jgi:cytochrome c2
MRPVMQMRLGWTIAAKDQGKFSQNAYFTAKELPTFDPAREGFQPLTVDLTPRAQDETARVEVSAAEGARLFELMGCVACHSTDGSTLGKVGPTFKKIFGAKREFADGRTAIADEAYLRESIKEPPAKVVKGFDKSDTGMPSYEGVLSDPQIESLILFLKTVK